MVIKLNKMKTYIISNTYDANDSFEIDAENENDAAFNALRSLGWSVLLPKQENQHDPDQYQFNF
jgi:hypothetical protein